MRIDKVILDSDVESIEEMFDYIANILFKEGKISNREIFVEALEEREAQSTTGLIDEIAIPHGQSDVVLQSSIIYVRNNSGIEWESLDGSKIKHVFALAIHEDEKEHLDNLISISSRLMDQEQRDLLRSLETEEEIIAYFKKKQ